jgi:CBS domain-containing protein
MVMTRSVVTVTQDATIVDAAKLMISHRISGVPVVDREGRLVGIATEGDLLRRAETGTERHRSVWNGWFSPHSRLAADYIKSHARRVADIMTRELVSVGELATLGRIADLLETKRIKRVPVVTVPRRARLPILRPPSRHTVGDQIGQRPRLGHKAIDAKDQRNACRRDRSDRSQSRSKEYEPAHGPAGRALGGEKKDGNDSELVHQGEIGVCRLR